MGRNVYSLFRFMVRGSQGCGYVYLCLQCLKTCFDFSPFPLLVLLTVFSSLSSSCISFFLTHIYRFFSNIFLSSFLFSFSFVPPPSAFLNYVSLFVYVLFPFSLCCCLFFCFLPSLNFSLTFSFSFFKSLFSCSYSSCAFPFIFHFLFLLLICFFIFFSCLLLFFPSSFVFSSSHLLNILVRRTLFPL